jgi:uncharacterized phage infection (PIP) family protein YhgE
MAKNPKRPDEQDEPTTSNQPKIMTKPLPEILDDLENYIKKVEEAVRLAQGAAKEAREAADMAKQAGEDAAGAARKAAESAVAKVRDEAAKAANTLNDKICEVSDRLDNLEDRAKQEAIALDDAFLALKDRHLEQSPFFEK